MTANPTFCSFPLEPSFVEKWRSILAAGNTEAAWSEFIERYRRLIFAVIRRSTASQDDADEVFADICGQLSSDNMSRIARHDDKGPASFSTWLATVVQHLAIDWLRHRDGRLRITTPENLSPLQQFIFDRIVREQCSYVEAYEMAIQRIDSRLSFRTFMNEVRSTFSILERHTGGAVHYFPGPPDPLLQPELPVSEKVNIAGSAAKVNAALDELPPDERLAIQLFIVEEVPAATVAGIVGWPNSKAVYNRVYRILERLRQKLPGLADE
jgi:RNA polymerase sigma factor (sigma-70 family)